MHQNKTNANVLGNLLFTLFIVRSFLSEWKQSTNSSLHEYPCFSRDVTFFSYCKVVLIDSTLSIYLSILHLLEILSFVVGLFSAWHHKHIQEIYWNAKRSNRRRSLKVSELRNRLVRVIPSIRIEKHRQRCVRFVAHSRTLHKCDVG